ncbi:MAG: DUF3349 domain-containing protein, partial [Mycolicibacterium sp.]|nr:DUF3349 domain-containing protein [Mycolicibacterium sp.]
MGSIHLRLGCMSRFVTAIINWLRAGYPNGVP